MGLAQMVVKRGGPPLDSRGPDLRRYWADELQDYLEKHLTIFGVPIPADGASEDLQCDPEIEPLDGIGGNDDLQRGVKGEEILGDSKLQKTAGDEKAGAQSQPYEVPDSD